MSPRVHRLCQPAPLRVPSTRLQTQRPCPAASRSATPRPAHLNSHTPPAAPASLAATGQGSGQHVQAGKRAVAAFFRLTRPVLNF